MIPWWYDGIIDAVMASVLHPKPSSYMKPSPALAATS
jgi:hypothetical protein